MHTDDISLLVFEKSASDIHISLMKELESVYVWSTVNKLTFNVEKTEYMIMGS